MFKKASGNLSTILIALFILIASGCSDHIDNINGGNLKNKLQNTAKQHPNRSVSNFSPQVGVNYNGQFDRVKFKDLERTQTTWVRGFIDFFQFYQNPEKLRTDQRMQKYLELKDHGYKTILNIKWNFHNRDFPEPGSETMEKYKAFLRRLLNKVWMQTDIIVAGNEPFIESKKSERGDRLVTFYKEIAKTINNFKKGIGSANDMALDRGADKPALYIGAFNNLYWPGWRTDAVKSLLSFVKEKPWISGIDLHLHHNGFRQLHQAIDFAVDKIRDNQHFLITEYSLVKHFRDKMEEPIPQQFADKYGWDPGTKNYQYLDFALKNPRTRPEWVDFLSESYWFENRKRYLRNSYNLFKQYDKFYVATYAMRQSFPHNRDFTRSTWPWILNGLYANRTVVPLPSNGQTQFNYYWINDFRRIQNGFFDR